MKKVCVIGLGYIGLPTAIIAAQHGYEVIGVDIDTERVAAINLCDPVIEEPEIKEKLFDAIRHHNLIASTSMCSADVYIVAVPTPCLPEKLADLSYVWAAVDAITKVITRNAIVILESTIPVGTTQKVAEYVFKKTGLDETNCFIAHCPERVLPGKIFYELQKNNRVLGGITPQAAEKVIAFYQKFVTGELYATNAETAEMIKLVENSYRDVNIAFAHQVAAMAEACNLEPRTVIEFANKHPRVNILQPSCGVGGHCIALDPWFLIESFPEHTKLLQAARIINDERPMTIVQKITQQISRYREKNHKNPQVLLLGLTYKPDVDDLRESPALQIAQELASFSNISLTVCEPHVKEKVIKKHTSLQKIELQKGVEQADIIIGLVNHTHFKTITIESYPEKKFLDFCGIFYKSHSKKETAEIYHRKINDQPQKEFAP